MTDAELPHWPALQSRERIAETRRVSSLAMRSTPSTRASSASAKLKPGVPGGPERLAGDDRDPRLLEDQLAELERVGGRAPADLAAEHALERGEAVERALRLEARDPGDRR